MLRTDYIWDEVSDTLIGEYDENGDQIASYTTEPELYGPVLSQHRADSGRSYYHHDAQGNTIALTDQAQHVTDTYAYNAFGERADRTGTTANPFGFGGALGYYANPETGDLDVRRRILRPTLARWLSRDPLGDVDLLYPPPMARQRSTTNTYTYVLNNPLVLYDPSGLVAMMNRGDSIVALVEEKEPKCECGEKTITPVGTVYVARKREDWDLEENILTTVEGTKKIYEAGTFLRKDKLVTTGKGPVKVILIGDSYKVVCCKGAELRLLVKEAVKEDVRRLGLTNFPTPPGPPTSANVEKVAKCAFPVAMIWYPGPGKGKKTDVHECLELAFPKATFGPVDLNKDTDLAKCGGP